MPENKAPVLAPVSARRARLTGHSTAISNAVLLGYTRLSDGAKLTYMVLESYDWPDKDGYSKGKCWPSIDTIAAARGKSYDTIARHLKELEAAGLIRVESGQERGVANCYWLLGPSDRETAAYKERFSGRFNEPSEEHASEEPAPVETAPEVVPQKHRAPGQTCGTPSGKHAPPAPAKLPEEEHEPKESGFKKFEPERDSNHSFTRKNRGGFSQPGRAGLASPYISQIMLDFSRALNDLSHAPSNQQQAQNLFRQSGLDEKAFAELLYEAKKRTQWAAIATPSVTGNGPNRAAYFFRVVRNLLEEKTRLSRAP